MVQWPMSQSYTFILSARSAAGSVECSASMSEFRVTLEPTCRAGLPYPSHRISPELGKNLLLNRATMSQKSSLTQSAHSVRQVLTAYNANIDAGLGFIWRISDEYPIKQTSRGVNTMQSLVVG